MKTCKDFSLVAVVSLFLVAIPGQCDENPARANFTQDSPLGLDRIKPVAQGQQNSHLGQVKSPAGTSSSNSEPETAGNPSNPHVLNFGAGNAENQDKSKNLDSRSNSSVDSGIISSKHPLFTGSHAPEKESSSQEAASHEIAHDHVVRYHQHQASDEDSREDISVGLGAHLNPPKSKPIGQGEISQSKLADSVVVGSDSFPVRVGPNTKIQPYAGNNGTGGIGIRKPIPIVRHEGSVPNYPSYQGQDHLNR